MIGRIGLFARGTQLTVDTGAGTVPETRAAPGGLLLRGIETAVSVFCARLAHSTRDVVVT
jgi:hypothetical protein